MGIFGSIFGGNRQPPLSGPVMPRAPMDPAFIPPSAPQSDPSHRIFGRGDIGGIIGGIGKIASFGPFVGMAQEGMNRRYDREHIEDAYKAAQIQHLGQTEEPSVIRTAKAIGLVPGTKEFSDWVTNATVAPRYMMMGSPETGQTIVNPAAPPGVQQGVPQAAIDRLRQNPGEAQQFDQIFGPGASQRALAGGR